MLALRDRPFMIFNLLIMGYWFLWVQFTISLPLIARALSGTAVTISFVYAINSGMNIVLGYPLIRLAERWLRPFTILIGGLIIMACGLGSIALVNSVPLLLLCVVFIALGSLLVMPSQQTIAASISHPEWLGSYLGLNALSLGLGGALGNYSGGLLYDLARSLHSPPLPWLVFLLVGLSSALGLWFLARSTNGRKLFATHLKP
ncbi:MAG: MFS transporter [Ktedonobacteraceae bacterium]|nr:MFS transporter [Ktedonobacteraceae bacterium]